MKRGEAKWLLHPLGVKVRIIIPEGDDMDFDYPIQNDYAGIESLKVMLGSLNYISQSMEDKIEWQVESLDPDWKSKHLEHLKDFYGDPVDFKDWFCEIESFESADEKDDYCIKIFNENKGISQDSPSDVKKVVEQFCRSKDKGLAIPLFLAEYQRDVKWIESHLKEVKNRRGTNPNSLKNLKQNRKNEEMKNAEEI